MIVERSPQLRANAAGLRLAVLVLAALVTPRLGQTQGSNPLNGPEAEFHMARLIHGAGGGYRGGYGRPWWAIDYPAAEYHLIRGLRRLTRLDVADDSIFLQSIDDRIFDYPWLFAQQVGRWQLSVVETDRLVLFGCGGIDLDRSRHRCGGVQWLTCFKNVRFVAA